MALRPSRTTMFERLSAIGWYSPFSGPPAMTMVRFRPTRALTS